MHTSHLRFGPALTPEQLAAYEELYPLFAAARDQIFKEAGLAATVPPPAALGSATATDRPTASPTALRRSRGEGKRDIADIDRLFVRAASLRDRHANA